MEQIRVSELASEFDMKNSVVIAELKKIGVWVPSADTPVDHDIADRIRRRLQLIVELKEQEQEKAKEKKEKKKVSGKTKKTIKELGKPRKKTVKAEEDEPSSPLARSLKPRKGKASYRKAQVTEEEELPQKTEVTIDDEPVIERVEAHISAEALEKAMQESSTKELKEMAEKEAEAAKPRKAKERPKAAAKAPTEEAEKPPEAPKEPIEVEEGRPETAEEVKEPVPGEAAEAAPPETQIPEPEVEEPVAERTEAEEAVPALTFFGEVTVKELGEKLDIKSNEILRDLMNRGVMANVNQALDPQIVQEICQAHGFSAHFEVKEAPAVPKEKVEKEKGVEAVEQLIERAPVVTVMGHVDHGKTSLLDAIRETKVAAGEAGGITQHIGAYHVHVQDRKIVFIDTPGHEAFTRMRARGAQATDLVVLVVAADDGVMPQTAEAIDHARAAGVPILVAVNKIDKPEAQPDRVKQALTEHQLVPEEWGGDTVMVEVSATEKKNLDLLLEMILLSSDLLELKADPRRLATGVVLEAKLEKGRGAVTTLLVQEGTLKVGHSVIAGASHGKIRAMFDDRGEPVIDAGPSTAVEVLGFQTVPQAGDVFEVLADASKAREVAQQRQEQVRQQELAKSSRVSLEDLYSQMEAGEIKELALVLKADTQGSIEVLEDTLRELATAKVHVNVIHKGVGAISESDILLASASNAIVVGFSVRPERIAQEAAEHEGVDVRLYTVIYDLVKEIKQAMTGLLEPTIRETDLGRAEVRQTFRVPRFGTIAGSFVQNGIIRRNARARILRDNVVVHEGQIDSLRRFQEDVNEVKDGYECGISIANFNDIKVGDVIEAYVHEEVAAELE